MIGYTRKVGLRKPGTFEWARSQIPPDSDGLAEWIAYQEGVLNQDQVESLRQWWHGYETRSIVEIEPGPDIDQDDLLAHCGNRTLTGDHHAVCDCPPSANLVDTIRKAAATLDGLPPEMRETLAHRTRTYSTECCYCDGSRTPLEDS